MATVRIPDEERSFSDPEAVRQCLAGIGIEYERWTPSQELSADSRAEEVLAAYSQEIDRLKAGGAYATADVIDVKPETPELEAMLAKFNREHWHDEDEVRFTVHGRGLYHVHPPNGPVIALEVTPGDMIRVPRGTLHWFDLCGEREIKAIRFFQDQAGWKPYYTESALEKQYQPLCFGPAYGVRPEQRLPAQIE